MTTLAAHPPSQGAGLAPATARGLIRAGLLITWVGLVSIGVSGLIAAGMGAAFGASLVSGDLPGVTYTPDRCAELMEYAPSAPDCGTAAAEHHLDETVTYRVMAGILGLFVLAAWFLFARSTRADPPDSLPDGFIATAGTACFGVVGLGLLAYGAQSLAFGAGGAGSWLSAAFVALAVAAVFAVRLYRVLLERAGRMG